METSASDVSGVILYYDEMKIYRLEVMLNMSRKTVWKRYVSVLIAFALVLGSILGAGNQK